MTDFLINYSAAEAVTLPDGRTWRGPNCESNAARQLLADGLAPDTRLVFCRDGKPALRGGIVTFAGRMWAGEASDPGFRAWRPHPHGNAPGALAGAPENGASGAVGSDPATDDETALAEGGAA
jgi:hypothetical protein